MEPTDERMEIAARLRLARSRSGLSQGQVAVLLHLHRPAISEIEAGRRSVAAEELSQLAEIFEVDVDWLLGKPTPDRSRELELAARELGKLRGDDLDRVLDLLSALRTEKKNDP